MIVKQSINVENSPKITKQLIANISVTSLQESMQKMGKTVEVPLAKPTAQRVSD